jgi:hypothetical protein
MNALTITITQLLSRLESLNQDNHRRTRDIILQSICRKEGIQFSEEQEITAAIEMLDVSDTTERQLQTSIQHGILRSLRDPTTTSRYEDLAEAHPNTFNWAFHDSTEDQLPWDNLKEWCESGNGVYWVSGKAGSGKSTLMKHLFDSPKTAKYLGKWARNIPLCFATFFFWNSGTKEQKSELGCLRALLFQVLRIYPALTPVIFPAEWANSYSKLLRDNLDTSDLEYKWSLRQLKDSWKALTHQKSVILKICFLVDGLDEFDGDHEEIGRFFKEITSSGGVKVCLSSRPWVVFEDVFHDCPKLRLQNLTFRDIERYVSDKLRQNEAFRRLAIIHPDEAPELVNEVVKKANGVFLWVELVVRSLLNGIRNRDKLSDLWERLRHLPRELEPLYTRLLELIEPSYLPWTSQAFQIVGANRTLGEYPFGKYSGKRPGAKPLSMSLFFLAITQDVDIAEIRDRTQLEKEGEDIAVQLTARCAGFLEVSRPEGKALMGPSCLIQYFHRTARDFLETKFCWCTLLIHTANTDFNPNVALMRACILALHINPLLVELDNELEKELKGKSHRCLRHITYLVNDTLIYAHHADGHTESLRTRITLLDQLCSVMDNYDGNLPVFANRWIKEAIALDDWGYRDDVNFLKLATIFNLRDYISEQVQPPAESAMTKSETATALLRFLLSSVDSVKKRGVPLLGIEMVSLLLDRGADPNESNPSDDGVSHSPWESALIYAMRIRDEASAPSSLSYPAMREIDCDYSETISNRYIRLLQMLVLSGADPHARVCRDNKRHEKITALDVVNSLLKSFPLEAGPLFRELQRALARTEHVKRNKRSSDEIHGNGEDEGLRRKKKIRITRCHPLAPKKRGRPKKKDCRE